MRKIFYIAVVAFCTLLAAEAIAQPTEGEDTSSVSAIRRKRQEMALVKKIGVMPYITLSYNLQSGQAFPKSATGVGYGFGIAFDFAPEKQPLGLYVDFAYQDMRASADEGACKLINENDTIAQTVPVTHYFSYALMEAFLKLQSPKTNGYFLIGGSFGFSTTGLSVREGPGLPEYSNWSGLEFYNKFRFDIRGGLGFKLSEISGHPLIFEARFGYPVTVVITKYQDICNGSSANGSWRDVTLQGNIGLRF